MVKVWLAIFYKGNIRNAVQWSIITYEKLVQISDFANKRLFLVKVDMIRNNCK